MYFSLHKLYNLVWHGNLYPVEFFPPAMWPYLYSCPLLSQCLPSTMLIQWQWWSVVITRKWFCLCKHFVYREDICVKNGYGMIYYYCKFPLCWLWCWWICCSWSHRTTSGIANDKKFISERTFLFRCTDAVRLLYRNFLFCDICFWIFLLLTFHIYLCWEIHILMWAVNENSCPLLKDTVIGLLCITPDMLKNE